jgi:RNA polymerase primary sigma factor
MIETINKLIRTSRSLVQELRREPTSEIAQRMDIPVAKVRKASRRAGTHLARDPDRRGGGQPSWRLHRGPQRPLAVGRRDQFDAVPARNRLGSSPQGMAPRGERSRCGSASARAASTLGEVGQNFAVTRGRIPQIEAKALRKLRLPVAEPQAQGVPRRRT